MSVETVHMRVCANLLRSLGIHAGIEALRVLHENKIVTKFPLCVVNWTNEEGARFPRSVMASSVWAELSSKEDVWATKEVPSLSSTAEDGQLKTVKQELQRIGWLGQTPCHYQATPLAAHFELHIEQGPVLERTGKRIGIVTGGQAYRWLTVTIQGREAHTGSTPFDNRSDALQAAAQLIVESKALAKQLNGLCSTGIMEVLPGSTNTIPGMVKLSLDIRHPQDHVVLQIEDALHKKAQRIAEEQDNCKLTWVVDTDSKAVNFHPDCIQAVRESAVDVVGEEGCIEMRSGAGHDSFMTSHRCPTSMIFVPSKDGVSHNEREFTSRQDCALGAQVLLGAALRYDNLRASQSSVPRSPSKTRSFHTLRTPDSLRRFSTSSFLRDAESGENKDQLKEKPRDTRPYYKKYPPPKPLPEVENFDQPAVANPIETAQAHRRFKKQARTAAFVLLGVILSGATVYLSIGVAHADDSKSLAAHTSSANQKSIMVNDLDFPRGELEKHVQEAQKGLAQGNFAMLALKRSTTIGKAVALCVWDYRQTLNRKYDNKAEENEEMRQCHLRSAHRILVALQENGGLYIKLGQHLSSVILLPVEWTNTMKPLQDQNTPTPLPELEAMFRAETGWTFDEVFSEIDAKPIGVASLAQVHRAVDRKSGKPLAVKLMHPQVERFSHVDMQTVNVLVRWVKKVFPDFEFTWLAEEMNENMPLEMDFRHEAKNAHRATTDFSGYKKTSVYIPKTPWVFKRAMAMEFIDGRRPDDLEYLAQNNIDRNRVSQELSRVFAQMLFMHGFFHGDPHGGNVLIRPAPKETRSPFNFEVVLLDHGLYFDIDKELRTNYARFWLSLLSKSTPQVQNDRRRYAKLIANIDDDLYPILESAITGRSGLEGSDDQNPHGVAGGKRKSSMLDLDSGSEMSGVEQEHIRKTVMEKEGLFVDILKVLRQVPRRMLMVLKLNDLTRSLDANLHTTHGAARPFIITARYCALAVWNDDRDRLREERQTQGFSLRWARSWVSSWLNYVWFYRGLSFFETLGDLNAERRKFFSFSAAFAKCLSLAGARRASYGLDSQASQREQQEHDQQRARQQVEEQERDALSSQTTKSEQ